MLVTDALIRDLSATTRGLSFQSLVGQTYDLHASKEQILAGTGVGLLPLSRE